MISLSQSHPAGVVTVEPRHAAVQRERRRGIFLVW
jgi:hypothetical protein